MTLPSSPGPATAAPGFFDARPLLDPVDPAEVAAFTRAQKAAHPTTGAQIAVWVIAIVALFLFVPVLGIMILGLGYVIGREAGVGIAALVAVVFLGGLVAGGIALARRTMRARAVARFRLSRFATANAMTYLPRIDAPPLPGMIFSSGSSRMSTDVLRGETPRFVEFGNYQYTTSNGKNSPPSG